MKKLSIAVLILSTTMLSCSNEDKLLSKLESHLKENLKDPSSYEKIEAKLDTTFVAEDLKNSVESLEDDLEYQKKLRDIWEVGDDSYNEYHANVLVDERAIKDLKTELSHTDPTKIALIYGIFKYRAKNGFGALGIEQSEVFYSPEKDKITTINTK